MPRHVIRDMMKRGGLEEMDAVAMEKPMMGAGEEPEESPRDPFEAVDAVEQALQDLKVAAPEWPEIDAIIARVASMRERYEREEGLPQEPELAAGPEVQVGALGEKLA